MKDVCPMPGMRECRDDCAWFTDGECAIKRIAISMYDKEMKMRFIARYMPNAMYGTLRTNGYVDTDSVRKENENENT